MAMTQAKCLFFSAVLLGSPWTVSTVLSNESRNAERIAIPSAMRDEKGDISTLTTFGDNFQGGKKKLKILINNPPFGWSHMQYHGRMADSLTKAGHEVHLLVQANNPTVGDYTGANLGQRLLRYTALPMDEMKLDNATDVAADDYWKTRIIHAIFNRTIYKELRQHKTYAFREWSMSICGGMLADDGLRAQLEREHYDVGISEGYHVCAFGAFKRAGIPVSIATWAMTYNVFAAYHFGVHIHDGWGTYYEPYMRGPEMSFRDRAFNIYDLLFDRFVERPRNFADFQTLFEPHFPPLAEVMRNVSLVFVNENKFISLSQTLPSWVIKVGGIVDDVGSGGTLDNVLSTREASIFANAIANKSGGVVLFSLGTLIEPADMSERVKLSFLQAFAHFPNYEFIWKHPGGSDLPLPTNVHLFDWVEQKALLRHPSLRAFISHCGLNGFNEAARSGVPMLCIPLCGDQYHNTMVMLSKGLGVHLPYEQCGDTRSIVDALKALLHDQSCAWNARLIGKKVRELSSPAERFVRWVQFAADYPAELLQNELGRSIPFHEELWSIVYSSLDVITVILGLLFTPLVVSLWLLNALLSLQRSNNPNQLAHEKTIDLAVEAVAKLKAH